jgi:VWFA-related protein
VRKAGSVAVLASIGLAWAGAGQEQRSSFGVATRLVQVDVIVKDKSGAPLAGLTAEDFELFEDGKPRSVELFSVEAADAAKPAEALPPGLFSNRLGTRTARGATVVLIDALNTPGNEQILARGHVAKFLGQLQADDLVAIYVLGSQLRVLHEFSRDTASLLPALERFTGATSRELSPTTEANPETGDAQMEAALANMTAAINEHYGDLRVRRSLDALQAIATRLAGMPGRKSLVWVSSNSPLPGASSLNRYRDAVVAAIRHLNDARVAVYPVDARGLVGAFATPPAEMQSVQNMERALRGGLTTLMSVEAPRETMFTLADRTGGTVFTNTNDISRSIRRAVEDSRLVYLLGFSPEKDNDKKYHQIKVKVRRAGAEVRHRTGFWATQAPQQPAGKRRDAMIETAQQGLEATGIGLRAQLKPASDEAANVVLLTIRLDPGAVSLQKSGDGWEASVDVCVAQGLPDDKLFTNMDTTIELPNLTNEMRDRLMKEGLVVNRKVPLRDDFERLYVAVQDVRTRTTGSLILPADKVRAALQR